MLTLKIFIFIYSRVSQYVYVPTKDLYFNTLDQHADTLEGDVKPPLVLVGNEGIKETLFFFYCLFNSGFYTIRRERQKCSSRKLGIKAQRT